MLDPIRAIEFYCGIGKEGSVAFSFSHCQHIEQVDYTTLFRGAASGTMRPLSAHLIGTNLLVPFTRQTTVLESHTVYALRCVAISASGL